MSKRNNTHIINDEKYNATTLHLMTKLTRNLQKRNQLKVNAMQEEERSAVLKQLKEASAAQINQQNSDQKNSIAGTIFGNVSNASTTYTMDKFNTPRGHGFAAENANHLADKLLFRDATIEGTNLKKHGADRIVNGIEIQTKYCNSASKTISECFQDGKFKYIGSNGEPMQIEVPIDQYDGAVQAMKNRIAKGEVPGVTNVDDVEKIVRKGHFTYEQVRNIAKFGTVESLVYDAANGAITSLSSFGITATISFAVAIWNGEDFDVALEGAVVAGIKVGGITFVSSILASQLARTSINSSLVGTTDFVIQAIGPKASAHLVNAFRSGNNIYGAAAMKSASKLLRGNIITGAITVAVMSSFDVVNIFRGRISGAQMFKNIANTASSVAGGTAGWVGGAATGAKVGMFLGPIGAAVGGTVGGLAGAFLAGSGISKVSNAVLSEFIEDDANEMIQIIEDQFKEMAFDYILNEEEAEQIVNILKDRLTGATLKDMYAATNHDEFAIQLLTAVVEDIVKQRKYIQLPKDQEINETLQSVFT